MTMNDKFNKAGKAMPPIGTHIHTKLPIKHLTAIVGTNERLRTKCSRSGKQLYGIKSRSKAAKKYDKIADELIEIYASTSAYLYTPAYILLCIYTHTHIYTNAL